MLYNNQLKRFPFIYWTCPPDRGGVTKRQAYEMKRDGYEKGVYDLTINVADENLIKAFLIEFKYGTNKYTPEQAEIASRAESTPVTCIKIYSLDEFIKFVEKELK